MPSAINCKRIRNRCAAAVGQARSHTRRSPENKFEFISHILGSNAFVNNHIDNETQQKKNKNYFITNEHEQNAV